jgi:hypothetical protein
MRTFPIVSICPPNEVGSLNMESKAASWVDSGYDASFDAARLRGENVRVMSANL